MTPIPISWVAEVWRDGHPPGAAEYYNSLHATGTITAAPLHEHAGINFRCPGCGGLGSVAFYRPDGGGVWTWDGNVEKPTVTPSILHNPGRCDWHGFLVRGEFRLEPA